MKLARAISELEKGGVRFDRLVTIVRAFWGEPRVSGTHHIWKTGWHDTPAINMQPNKGSSQAKPYQTAQVLTALTRLSAERPDR